MLVRAGDFVFLHLARDGNRTVEVVGVRRAQSRDRTAGLSPGRCGCGMRVHHTPDLYEMLVEDEMCRRVGRGTQIALYDAAVLEGYDHQVLRSQLVVGHAARLDDEYSSLTIHAAGVPKRQRDQSGSHQALVGAPDLLAEVGKGERRQGSS